VQETVRSAAVVVALVPQGLALLITVTYAAAAARLARRGMLVQQANAVESLAHVDLLCLDKTGTITTNRLAVEEIRSVEASPDDVRRLLGDMVASMSDQNRTAAALAAALPGRPKRVVEEVAFTSDRKWSGLTVEEETMIGSFVLGAPEVLAPAIHNQPDIDRLQQSWADRGRRVLLFAYRPDMTPLHGQDGEPALPGNLTTLALIALTDQLRPEANNTLRHFADLGVRIKLISGDDPRTVAALVRQADFPISGAVVSGLSLGKSKDPGFAPTANDAVIFGRTTPEQKEDLVRFFRDQGHHVAMIGDGVNDIPSLKEANLGISMMSGTAATRGVADLVLLDDSFAALPAALREGQRILAAMYDAISLFLVRSLFVLATIVGAALVSAPFPVTPQTNALLAILTVGIPSLVLIAWSKPVQPTGSLAATTLPFVLPAALTMAPLALTLYLAWWRITDDLALARTVLTATGALCGLFVIPYAKTPSPAQFGGNLQTEDRRPVALAVILLGVLVVVFGSASLRSLFDVVLLSAKDVPLIVAPVVGWAIAIRWAWRHRLFHALFGLKST
jgi:cation-transporting ATPase E